MMSVKRKWVEDEKEEANVHLYRIIVYTVQIVGGKTAYSFFSVISSFLLRKLSQGDS